MLDWYKYFRWLSLDIVLGAIFFLAFLGEYYQAPITISMYLALGATVWLIYTTDHLIDARKLNTPSASRHQFHKKNYRNLIIIASVVLVASLINVMFLPEILIKNGSLLASGCVLYLLAVYLFRKLWIKELLVAIGYSCGIFLAPLTLKGSFFIVDVLLVGQLILIAFLNLIIISYFDRTDDRRDGFSSLIIKLGDVVSKRLILLVSWSIIFISGGLYLYSGSDIELMFLSMSCILYLIYLLPQAAVKERFRIVGDGIFYLPLLFLL